MIGKIDVKLRFLTLSSFEVQFKSFINGLQFKTGMEFKLNMVYGDLMWKQENIYSGLLMVNFLYFLGIKVSILGAVYWLELISFQKYKVFVREWVTLYHQAH